MNTQSAKQNKSKRSSVVERAEVIVVSTAHVPESLATADDFAARAAYMDGLSLATGRSGWLVRVDRDLSSLSEVVTESIAEALKEILWWAKRRGAQYVLFDADGPVLERFAVYDW